MAERCRYIQDKIPSPTGKGLVSGWIFIPGCIGGAVTGPHACTCRSTEHQLERFEKKLDLYREALRHYRSDLRWLVGKLEHGFTLTKLRQIRLTDEANKSAPGFGLKLSFHGGMVDSDTADDMRIGVDRKEGGQDGR